MGATTYPNDQGSVQRAMAVPTAQTPWSSVHESKRLSDRAGNVSRFTPAKVQDPSAKVTRYPGTQSSPVNLNDGRYDNSWMAFMGQDTAAAPVISGRPAPDQDQGSWRDRLYAERAASANRSSSVAGGQTQRTVQPMEAMKAPDLPEYKGVGEYAPPEEDKGVYAGARREAMGPGMRELREGTREAISSAQSLDNPNARAKFIQQSLKGYGQGLEKVAAGAAKEGRTEARSKRQEQLATYKTNYDIRSDTYLKNYQNQISTIAANFASQQAAQTANWNAGMDPSVNVAGQTGDPRDKSTYYPGGY